MKEHPSIPPTSSEPRVETTRRTSAEWQSEVSQFRKMWRETLDNMGRLERIREREERLTPEQQGWLYALLHERPELLSDKARMDIAQAMHGEELARELVMDHLGHLKQLAEGERSLYEAIQAPKEQIDALMAARQEHVNVLMKEWGVQ